MTQIALDQIVSQALSIGFSQAAPLDVATLTPLDAVRDMCAANRCGLYGRCWTCPPGCGSLAENVGAMRQFSSGVLVQTTMSLEDDFDYPTMQACGNDHRERFLALNDQLRASFPGMLALGAGGCRLCEACAYPDSPCRMPEKALSSMEAYGLLVSEVCQNNGLAYYYGPGTITYTGCYLLF